jgi:dihydrofolate synthase / folylpolyglutamate synthase
MQLIPIKTRILQPPQDDLFEVLDESLLDVKEGDVVVVSSKVISIHEGNCVPVEGADKKALIAQEAQFSIPRSYWPSPLTVAHNAFIGTAGIDESNADGHYVLLPRDPFVSAKNIYDYVKGRFQVQDIAVVITDSHSSPLRRGAMGVAIGWWGIAPTINHVGKPDLFGREFRIEVSNIADAIAAAAGLVMGETDECQPVVIARAVPDILFVDRNTKDELFVAPKDDTFRVLYEDFLT